MEAQQIKSVIERALVSFSGVTTSAGHALGTTLVCSALTSMPDFDGLTVLIAEGTYTGQARDINGATTGGTITVTPAFGGQIPAGINFHIITGIPSTKEVADVQADIGDASAATLGSLLGILGNPAQTFLAMVGYEGAASLANKLTAARAGYVDNLNIGETVPTQAQINTQVDNALNTAIPGTPTADSVNERIKALDDLVTAAYGATEKAAIDLLDDAGYGLAALDTELGLIPQSGGTTTWNATALAAINAEVDTALNTVVPGVPTADSINERIKTLDDNYTAARAGYLDNINQAGLLQVTAARAALLDQITALRMAELDAANIPADVDKIPKSDGTVSWNATALAAINAEVDTALNTAVPGVPTADSVNERIKALDDAYTATRAGYLDNINQAGLLQVTAARATLLDQITAARLVELDAANIPADTDPKVMGRLQIKATTISLNQVAGTYDLFTGTTQDVVVEKLVIRMPNAAAGGALTSISIQTDDATPQVFISSTDGAVANLTAEAQLAWTGAVLIDAGTGAKIRLTIAGGATGVAYVCDVIAECRAVVAGGYLA